MKIRAVIEIPMGSKYKYEFHDGVLKVDRVLNQRIPYNYGYIPSIISEDNDPLDIFILTNEPLPPLTVCEVEILGGFKCIDQGLGDDKLYGKLVGENIYPNIASIKQYLTTYKEGFQIIRDMVEIDIKDLLREQNVPTFNIG